MGLDLRLWDTKIRVLRPIATIHLAGKLGFNMDASKFLNLDGRPSFVVATKKDDPRAQQIFLIETENSIGNDIPPVVVSKAGSYFYLGIRNVLDQLGIDYTNRIIVYEITKAEEDYMGCPLYVLTRVKNKLRARPSQGHEGQNE